MARTGATSQKTDAADNPVRRRKREVMREPSRFFSLSPEIRNTIYKLALLSDEPIVFRYLPAAQRKYPLRTIQLRGLTQVSRACRHECLLIFWSINCFWMHDGASAWSCVIADQKVCQPVIASLRRLRIDRGRYYHADDPPWNYMQLDLEARSEARVSLVRVRRGEHWGLLSKPGGVIAALNHVAAALFWPAGELEVSAEAITGMSSVTSVVRHADLAALGDKTPEDLRLEFLNGERYRRARALEKQLGLGEYEVEDAQSYQAARRLEQHLGLARNEIEECETWDLVDWSDGEVSQWAARREAAFDEAVRESEAWRNGTGRSEV
ncbi:hypothetical protein B0A48_02081 [Cryoendolithus antarcticus]|uniref:Uncharacterized protein n=1 Tax=Cryoendolithus antarcticus TaxID=1507870 RepID=A0A1V8TML1_9PEZI|nr:hypothetical protein B0A48_02081 [Cryoendolithus antarcticus]